VTRPEWMVPGQPVAALRSGTYKQSVTYSTIDRVLKRDVVLADGQRFNADRPVRRHGGAWDGATELFPRNHARVLAAEEQVAFVKRRRAIREAAAEIDRSAQHAGDDDDLDGAIANARYNLAKLAGAS